MSRMVYLDPRVEKQMRVLRRAGKKGFLAAAQADHIIGRLLAGRFAAANIGSITKHGELRIKGCIKYDLGSGYRLVTFKRGRNLFILYMGSHDDCHRWIENNRELPIERIEPRCKPLAVNKRRNQDHRGDAPEAIPDMEDNDILAEPDDRHLRAVFSGLTQQTRNDHPV